MPNKRQSLSIRTRFEVFKRDGFTCQYCGRTVPNIVLEVDHIIPVADGGTNDPINLITACWDCNHGKAGVSLGDVTIGPDPNTLMLQEKERKAQLQAYYKDQEYQRLTLEDQVSEAIRYWCRLRRGSGYHQRSTIAFFVDAIGLEAVKEAMKIAKSRPHGNYFKYFCGIAHNWLHERKESQ